VRPEAQIKFQQVIQLALVEIPVPHRPGIDMDEPGMRGLADATAHIARAAAIASASFEPRLKSSARP
jgi:hypothetical protein